MHSSNTHAQPSSGAWCLIFGWTLHLLPFCMCVNSKGSGETVRLRRLAWAFAGCLCNKYLNLMSWLNCFQWTFYRWSWCNYCHSKFADLNIGLQILYGECEQNLVFVDQTFVIYSKTPKNSDTQNICCNHSKILTRWLHPKDADRKANRLDPGQTAPGAVWSGSTLFAQACMPENLGTLRYDMHEYSTDHLELNHQSKLKLHAKSTSDWLRMQNW